MCLFKMIYYFFTFTMSFISVIKEWDKSYCFHCDCYDPWDSWDSWDECVKTTDKIGHRLTFTFDPTDDPKGTPTINCKIETFLEGDGTIQWAPEVRPGNTTQWNNDGIECKDTCELIEFDFTFTTNDSDISIFEPHIGILQDVFEIEGVRKKMLSIVDSALIHKGRGTKKRKKSKNRKDPMTIDMDVLKKTKDKYKVSLSESILSKFPTDSSMLRWAQPIAKTLATVFVEDQFLKTEYSRVDVKDCPHVEKRKKKFSRRQ